MTESTFEPMLLEPLLVERVWGGGRLLERLGKQAPAGLRGPFGESWELADLPEVNSRIASGPLSGQTLAGLVSDPAIMASWAGDIMPGYKGRFPWLLKFIDAAQDLSIQVHPDDKACERLGGAARPKTEAWYIIDAAPDAALYIGVAEGTTPAAFEAALREDLLKPLLTRIPVSPGQFFFIPAGTLHAIGGGILLAEVQQTSDTTYRVYDWGRVGLDGKPRQLHITEALASIRFDVTGPVTAHPPPSGRPGIRCPYFTMEELRAGNVTCDHAGAVMVVRGDAELSWDKGELPLPLGSTALLPSSSRAWRLDCSAATALVVTLDGLPC